MTKHPINNTSNIPDFMAFSPFSMIILIKITTKTDINHLEKGSNFKVSVCYSNAYVSNFILKKLMFFLSHYAAPLDVYYTLCIRIVTISAPSLRNSCTQKLIGLIFKI